MAATLARLVVREHVAKRKRTSPRLSCATASLCELLASRPVVDVVDPRPKDTRVVSLGFICSTCILLYLSLVTVVEVEK